MSNIEISTAHNITITYPLATIGQRILAYVIDGIVVFVYILLTLMVTGGYDSLFYIFIFPVFAFYHLLFEIFNRGQSIGKRIMKLRVVSLHGSSPSVMDFIKRWIFRLIDLIFSGGSLAVLFITGTSKKQRLGDMVAQTTVISLRGEKVIDLDSINDISLENTKILYPGVVRYQDADMLLLKQIIMRYNGAPHNENRKMMRKMFDRITEDLGIDKDAVKPKSFLKTVLKEYILLTR